MNGPSRIDACSQAPPKLVQKAVCLYINFPFNKDSDRWATKIREKKRQRVSSSDAKAETNDEVIDSQDGALISLTVTEYQVLIAKITSLRTNTKKSDNRILNLEARLDEAQAEIDSLKKQKGVTRKIVDETNESLEFTQVEHSDLTERVTMCETEQSAQWSEITHQSIYNRRPSGT